MTVDHDGFIYNFHNDLPWIPSKIASGIDVKNLGKANGRFMQLVRFQPGASFPSHVHTDAEFIFVLDGEVRQNGTLLSSGWSAVAQAGSHDHTFTSSSGCTFLLIYSLETLKLT